MSKLFLDGLFLPSIILAVAAFAVPRMLARALPEGVKPLLLNAFLSAVLLAALSAMFFVALYFIHGASLDDVTAPGLAANVAFFGRLGLMSALIWAPIMILSVAGLPRKWMKTTW